MSSPCGSPMDTTITINPEAVKPIVNKHFDRISETQWSLLASGVCDPEVEAILTDMLCEIIQTVSASAVRIVLPMFQELLRSNASQDEINTALEYVNTQLGESLVGSFAELLHVPPERSESVDKLTELVEEEVSLKVATAVSLAINSPNLQRSSAIFVTGSISNTESHCQMLSHVIECLRGFMNKMKSSCLSCLRPNSPKSTTPTLEAMRCESSQSLKSKISLSSEGRKFSEFMKSKNSVSSEGRESSEIMSAKISVSSAGRESSKTKTSKISIPSARCESSQSSKSKISVHSVTCESPKCVKSKVSVHSVTQAVAQILDKWSTETPDIQEEAGSDPQNLGPSLDACDAAFEIVRIISDNLHYSDNGDDEGDEEVIPAKHHFSLRLILNKVKEFFACQARRSTDTSDETPEERKCRFLKFSKKQFQKMESELKMSLEKEDLAFSVPLGQDSGSSQSTLKKGGASDEGFDLPGAVPESPRPKSAADIQTSWMPLISLQEKLPPIEFDSIKNAVETLFDISNLTEASAPQAKESLRNLAKQLSKDLTDKIYSHVSSVSIDRISSNPLRRSVSDPVIVRLGKRLSPTVFNPSLESRYVMIEDSVGKFLQQMCLWVEHEQSNQTSHSEKVSGALAEIKDLIQETVTPPEEVKDRFQETVTPPEEIKDLFQETVTPPEEINAAMPESLCFGDTVKGSQSRATSCSLLDDDALKYLQGRSYNCPTPVELFRVDSSKSVGGLSAQASGTSSRVSERTTNNMVTALLMRLIMTEVPKHSRKSTKAKDIGTIIKRLSEVARDNINISDSDIKRTKNNMTKINKAVIRDLAREFGSSDLLLEASMAENNSAFNRAVIKYLKVHLDDLYRPKRSAFARFFIRVGKALAKPFMCCCPDSDD